MGKSKKDKNITPLEPVLETRSCEHCEGNGYNTVEGEAVGCKVCKGIGRIFKDGTVVHTKAGVFEAKYGKLSKIKVK